MKILPLVILLTFTGCGTPKVWYQPGKTPAEAYHDLSACKLDAARAVDPHGLGMVSGWGGLIARDVRTGDLIHDCMLGKGYVPTPQNLISNGNFYPHP